MPFEELSHSADWCLHVWADELTDLFAEAAEGMNALAGISLADNPQVRQIFSISAPDIECLLVSFLSELAYCAEKDHRAFDRFELKLDHEVSQPCHLSARLHGAPILSMNKLVKAVTYHNLQIHQTTRGFEVEIVFDV
jgi:SHS2 domain-containing protein